MTQRQKKRAAQSKTGRRSAPVKAAKKAPKVTSKGRAYAQRLIRAKRIIFDELDALTLDRDWQRDIVEEIVRWAHDEGLVT